ncbi:hypothetical protein [Archangium violaceum]|uniref:hypothetical protein n=1 Tax=Archangium violaceum TaxID=83451 RepID=UPI0036DADF7F
MNPEKASDEEFLSAVECAQWPGEHFGHREHVRLAWLYLRRHGPAEGYERIRGTIQKYATALGAPGKYHETVTRAWSAHVYRALKETPELEPFSAFQEAHAGLRDSKLLSHHYRKETLEAEGARREWVAPDVSPLPAFP